MCYLKNDNPLRKNTIKRAIFQRCLRKSEREYLRGVNLNDTIKRVETKTCFKYPEREYLRGANLNDTIKRAKNQG